MSKLVLEGQNAVPRRTLELGYRHRHPDLDEALRSALRTLDHRSGVTGKVPRVNASSQDRYEPLPGLLEIPGFLVRKIPPRARKPAAFGGAILLAAVAVALVLSIPAITESKDERAATEARQEREHRAQRAAELQAELRLREGRGEGARGLKGAEAIAVRQALVGDLNDAVHADALSRVQSGEFTQSIDRVECERFPRSARGEDPALDLGCAIGRYSCLAITADAPAGRANQSQQPRLSLPRAAALQLRPLQLLQDQRPPRRGLADARVPGAHSRGLRRRRALTHRGPWPHSPYTTMVELPPDLARLGDDFARATRRATARRERRRRIAAAAAVGAAAFVAFTPAALDPAQRTLTFAEQPRRATPAPAAITRAARASRWRPAKGRWCSTGPQALIQ